MRPELDLLFAELDNQPTDAVLGALGADGWPGAHGFARLRTQLGL